MLLQSSAGTTLGLSLPLLSADNPFADAVPNGSMLLALPVAPLAGFASPCVLPPDAGYLGYVTGLTGVDLERQRRRRIFAGTGLFVLAAVFMAYGALFGPLGSWLRFSQDWRIENFLVSSVVLPV